MCDLSNSMGQHFSAPKLAKCLITRSHKRSLIKRGGGNKFKEAKQNSSKKTGYLALLTAVLLGQVGVKLELAAPPQGGGGWMSLLKVKVFIVPYHRYRNWRHTFQAACVRGQRVSKRLPPFQNQLHGCHLTQRHGAGCCNTNSTTYSRASPCTPLPTRRTNKIHLLTCKIVTIDKDQKTLWLCNRQAHQAHLDAYIHKH